MTGEELEPTPWSFRVVIGATILYLLWRLIQGIAWVIDRL